MRSRRWTKYLVGLVMIVIMIPGVLLVSTAMSRQRDDTSGAEANRKATCKALVDTLVNGLANFTRQFDNVGVLGTDKVPPMPEMGQLRDEAAGLERQLKQEKCRTAQVRDAVEEWRETAAAKGPLAEAVRAAMASNVIDVLDKKASPARHEMATGDDLATVLSGLPAGATLVLPAGRFHLERTVAFVQDVTIEGAGPKLTTITTTAPDAGLVLASQVAMRISGVKINHRGGGSASVLMLRAGTAELDNVQVGGATRKGAQDKSAGVLAGGSGIVVAGAQRLMMRGSTSSGNAVGGLLVAAGTPDVRHSTFKDNVVCGVCYVGQARGQLLDSIGVGNGAGVMLGDRSAPTLRGNRIERNRQAGMVIEASSHPMVRGNTIRANGSIGVAVYAKAAPRLVANTVSDHRQAGVLVDAKGKTSPRLEKNILRNNGSAGLVFTGTTRAKVTGNTCSGARFGIVLDGSAAPTLRNNRCAVQDQRPLG